MIMKKFVPKRKAFTLLEALMGLFIMSILCMLLLTFMNINKYQQIDNKELEQITLFIIQVQKDLSNSKEAIVTKDMLTLINEEEQRITYQYDRKRLIRQVNKKGYQITLNNLDKIKFYQDKKIIKIKVIFQNKEKYEEVLGATP